MRSCIAFWIFISISVASCGGSGDLIFRSIDGTWQVNADDILSVENCAFRVGGGLSGDVKVVVSGDVVTITTADDVGLVFTGSATDDGFSGETLSPSDDRGCSVRYSLSVAQVSSEDFGSGTARYEYRETCPDDSICRFTAAGPARHLTEN